MNNPCQQNAKSTAFTLIELMVSLGILVMIILATMGVYIHVIGTREKTLGQLDIQRDGHYLMNLIVKDVRAGMIDYDNYGAASDCGEIAVDGLIDKLCLLDFSSSSNEIRYKKEVESATRNILERCEATTCTSEHYDSITMSDNTIARLDFYIKPIANPFYSGSTVYKHPRVTIVLTLESLVEKPGMKELVLQQTVPQRYAQRN
ncbi:prepilin-type N-terminal cleavage/methylation domain-containing protein [Patescibacteria group bacterium]|nr:prepilin-type N-terminal cleavage/methylation domain-containing protein [Patescibacteria group bacterium]